MILLTWYARFRPPPSATFSSKVWRPLIWSIVKKMLKIKKVMRKTVILRLHPELRHVIKMGAQASSSCVQHSASLNWGGGRGGGKKYTRKLSGKSNERLCVNLLWTNVSSRRSSLTVQIKGVIRRIVIGRYDPRFDNHHYPQPFNSKMILLGSNYVLKSV